MEPLKETLKQELAGIPGLEEEHRRLVELTLELSCAVTQHRNSEVVAAIAIRLFDYALFYLEAEEQMMRRMGASRYAAHKREHDTLTEGMAGVKSSLMKGDRRRGLRPLGLLLGALLEHARYSDPLFFIEARRSVWKGSFRNHTSTPEECQRLS